MQNTFSKIIFSLDGGATSSKFGVISEEKILKSWVGKPLYTDLTNKEFIKNLLEIIKVVKQKYKIDKFIFGISGIDTDQEKSRIEKIVNKIVMKYFPASLVVVVSDIDLVLLASKENRVALIAGTGTNCVGEIEGVVYKSGGLGKDLADQGSGYWISKKALELAVKSHDKRGQETILQKEIIKYFKTKELNQVKTIISDPNFSKANFAAIVPIVVNSFKKGDGVSGKILQFAGLELALHVISIFRQSKAKNAKVYLAGNIFKIDEVKRSFEKNVEKHVSSNNLLYIQKPTFTYGINYFINN